MSLSGLGVEVIRIYEERLRFLGFFFVIAIIFSGFLDLVLLGAERFGAPSVFQSAAPWL